MNKFELARPSSLPEALELLQRNGPKAKVIAGGTDLIVQMKGKLKTPEIVIGLWGVSELMGIEDRGEEVRVGSLTRHALIENSPVIREKCGLLSSAAHKIGSPQIRSLGTLGGNLCNASPAADSAPPLLVLEAEGVLVSRKGSRSVPMASFFKGPGETVSDMDELLKEIRIPRIPPNSGWAYLKLGRRKSLDLALVSAAVLLTFSPKTKICERARVALGAVAPTPLRAKKTEKFLEGKPLDDSIIREAAAVADKECSPISDVRASAEYRREMVRILVARAIQKSMGETIPPTGI